MSNVSPYGTWTSPISAAAVAAGAVRLGNVDYHGRDLWWTEGRPAEGGRTALMCRTAEGAVFEATSAPYDVRTRAHEYGGRAFVVHSGHLWCSHDADARLYAWRAGYAQPAPLTDAGPWRYADLAMDPRRRRLLCVREDHGTDGEPRNELVAVDIATGAVRVLASGHDFYSNPRPSPDGRRLCFLTWDHPRMPWEGTELWVADVQGDGALGEPRRVAGGPGESVFQPEWGPDGRLWFVSDASGWWNLHWLESGGPRNVLPMDAEFGRPQWAFGMRTYGFAGDGSVITARSRVGQWSLLRFEPGSRTAARIDIPFTDVADVAVAGTRTALVAGAPDRPAAIVMVDIRRATHAVVRSSVQLDLDPRGLSQPQRFDFPTAGGEVAHAFYYPPCHAELRAPDDERPPLVVIGHGGPTGATSTTLSLAVQFWTSRGFAVADVNYRGSTGYGRAYRDRLRGEWGVVDVEDCVHAARHLAETDRADPERLLIRGSSAGGYTVLAALTFHDAFRAGASHYGIGDLESLASDTHKFESRYLDWLVGPWPEAAERYQARSPLHHVERLTRPVIFFQGREDKVVPPDQAERMAEALRRKGVPVACLVFDGEQHGFRRAETIVRALEAELGFYGRVLGFQPAGVTPPPIDNLPD